MRSYGRAHRRGAPVENGIIARDRQAGTRRAGGSSRVARL